MLRPARVPPNHFFHNGPHGRSRRNEALLDPPMAHAPGVGRGPDVDPRARPVWAVAGKQIAVLLPCEVGQLVKSDEVVRLALVFDLVLGVLHRSKQDLCPGGEGPGVAAPVIPGLWECSWVVVQGLVDQLRQLGKGLAEDQRLVVRDVDLSQRLDHQRVALPSAGGSSIQRLILRPGHKCRLPGLGPPHDVSHLRSPPGSQPRRCPRSRLRRQAPDCISSDPACN